MKIVSAVKDGVPIVPRVEVALFFSERLHGLMARSRPGPGYGMLFPRCGALHTCFMRFDLDVFFFDRSLRIVRVVRGVKPWRLCFGGRTADSALEIESGWLSPADLREDDRIAFVPPSHASV